MLYRNPLLRAFVIVVVVATLVGTAGYVYILSTQDAGGPPRSEWAYRMVEATKLNDEGYFGEDVVVAIIDTGIDIDHPELADYKNGRRSLIWKDYVGGDPEPYDDNGHGTAMVSLIAGKTYGIAPRVDLIVIKTINAEGTGSVDHISNAISFAIENGADIISMSLGGGRFPIIGTDAERRVQDAVEEGIFVVAAAGNDGESDNGDVDSPSNVELAISAGAVDENGVIAPFSSRGDNDGSTPFPFDDRNDPNKKPEIVAPGVDITVALNGGNYGTTSGTSVATAIVSGVIALTLDVHEGYQQENNNNDRTISEYKDKLMETAAPAEGQPSYSHDDHYGYGIIKGDELSDQL
jgi:serine protease AprX